MYFVLGMKSEAVGLLIFGLTVVFWMACLYRLATLFLFDRTDSAELQLIGAVRFGEAIDAFLTGKGATWPFAKLSASKHMLRLQTPWGDFVRQNNDQFGAIHKTGSSKFRFDGFELTAGQPITFFVMPWDAAKIERELGALGYCVEY